MKTEQSNNNIQQSDSCNVIDSIEFKDKQEKCRYVDCIHIESVEQLVIILSDLKRKNSFFRGQKDWKWRVNSGVQREWFKNRTLREKYYKNKSSVNQFFQEFLDYVKTIFPKEAKCDLLEFSWHFVVLSGWKEPV
ncbi:MAG: hypothetical protein NTV93_20340 [Verrucomicrobia bacterium]|nr:hypothetical protein [Verrucomicrobiota bacterium]